MKRFKNILASLLLSFIIFCYFGHGIVDHYGQLIPKIERTVNNASSKSVVSSESSLEDDVLFVFPIHSDPIINSGSKKYFSFTCSFPCKLVYPVWLPPEIS